MRLSRLVILTAFMVATLPPGALAETIDGRGLLLEIPDGWRTETPSSSMRLAQIAVPGSGGDGQLTMFHFGVGGGGGVEPNIERWVSQMVLEPGTTPSRETFDVGPLKVHFVEANGTAKASRVGSFPSADQPGWQLFGAVVEGVGGPWYVRIVGPANSLAEQREAFLGMLQGARTSL